MQKLIEELNNKTDTINKIYKNYSGEVYLQIEFYKNQCSASYVYDEAYEGTYPIDARLEVCGNVTELKSVLGRLNNIVNNLINAYNVRYQQ